MTIQPSLFDDVLQPVETLEVSPARTTDPETAHEASEANEDSRSEQRTAVHKHYLRNGEHGSTDYETGLALGILRTSAGKRRHELWLAGYIEKTEMRRPTDTGSTAIVWRAIPVVTLEYPD